jgi:Lar family restriction alleviation protein
MSAPELKPCPFCGNAAYTDLETAAIMGARTSHDFAIACRWCEVSAPGRNTFDEAVTAWNTRADIAAAQIEAARRDAWAEAMKAAADFCDGLDPYDYVGAYVDAILAIPYPGDAHD